MESLNFTGTPDGAAANPKESPNEGQQQTGWPTQPSKDTSYPR